MSKDFYATRSTAWWKVAIAMIGSALSAATYVSATGMPRDIGWGYLQMCLGFFLGYLVIAFVLSPLYFRLNVTSVYEYLDGRFGVTTHKTGAWFFFVSKMLGASVRLFVMIFILQKLIFDPLCVPLWATTLAVVALVWLYTVRGGVKAVLTLDIIKTVTMLAAVVLCLVIIIGEVGAPDRSMMRIFYFDDVNHPQFFFKQLLGGFFTVIALTGLDQDMMQRTLACRNVRDSQKNLMLSIVLQIVFVTLFLLLGVYLYMYASLHGISVEKSDEVFAAVTWSGKMPYSVLVAGLFIVGLVMAGFPSGGSSLTALTTSFTIDILGGKEKYRKWVHTAMAALMAVCILVFNRFNNTSLIDAIYRLASYTYGPILGLFSFGLLWKRKVRDRWVPLVCILAPVLCLVLDLNSIQWFGGYKFSYELLPLNAIFTIIGLWLIRRPSE